MGSNSVNVSLEGGGTSANDPNAHKHTNLDVLERITTDDQDYICLNDYMEVTDPTTGEGTGEYIEQKKRAKVGYADEAGKLAEEAMKLLMEMFLRKDQPDSTKFLVQFLAGLEAGLYASGGTDGSKLHSDGLAELGRLQVNGDSEFRGNLSSQDFISGFMTGKGWAMQLKKIINAAGVEETKAVGELDDLIVRGTLRVFEFVVSQLLGENDNRVFTAMLEVDHYDPITGRVWLNTQNGKLYNPFRVDDCIVVQQYNGMPSEENDYYITKQYELVITGVGVGDMSLGEDRLDWVTFKNFTTTMEGGDVSLIAKGDTFVRWDNLSDPNRKGIIQMMTVGESTPYMDVAYGLKTDPDNAHKGRFGNLEGIYNRLFGWLKDFGAYLINFYGVGDFRFAHSGEDASDKIEMVQGAFRTNFKQSYFDLTDEDNFLTNGSFSGELEGWVTGDSATDFLTINGLAIYANRSLMVDSPCFVGKAIYNDKDMLRIHNSDIRQPNSYVRQPGTHKEYVPMDGSEDEPSYDYVEVPDKMFLGIRFHCVREGELEFGFANNDVSAEALPYTVMHVSKSVEAQSVEVSGIWNGKGDFVIKTTGDIYIDWLVLSDKPLDNLKTTTRTWIEQDAGRIALLGQNIVKNGQIITDLGIELDAVNEQIGLYIDKTNAIEGSVLNLGIRLDGVDESISIYAAKTDANTASISALQVEVDSINLTVVEVQGDLDTARAIAEAAAEAADHAQDTADNGLYKATSNASVIQMHTDSISILNGRFAADGSLVNTSGLVTTSEYNSLYSAHYDLAGEVATKADVSTSVQYDPTSGDIISNVKITADVVDINNGVVQIDSDSATIGGFKITDDSFTSNVNNEYTVSINSGLNTLVEIQRKGYDILCISRNSDPSSSSFYSGRVDLFSRNLLGTMGKSTELIAGEVKARYIPSAYIEGTTDLFALISGPSGLRIGTGVSNDVISAYYSNAYGIITNTSWPTASGQVPIGGIYRDGSTLKVRTS